MDVSLGETNPNLGTYWRTVIDFELHDVLLAGYKSGSVVVGHEEGSIIVWIPDGNMSIYIEHLMLVEDMVGNYQTGMKIVQTRLGPVTKVSDRHIRDLVDFGFSDRFVVY